MSEQAAQTRPPTAIDAIANDFFDELVATSPMWLTELGSPERQTEYDDLSPAGVQVRRDLMAQALARLDAEQPADAVDRVTVAAMKERLGLDIELIDSGLALMDINGIASGLHAVRAVYDQMPTATADHWRTIAARLAAVPGAIDGWFTSQHAGIEAGVRPAVRQVNLLVEQVRSWVGADGFFEVLVGSASTDDGAALAPDVADALTDGVRVARAAFTAAADRLEGEIIPLATDVDAVGRERYQLCSRSFLGSTIDLEETYAWGLAEVARIDQMMRETAAKVLPGEAGDDLVVRAQAALDADPAYQLTGTDALRTWMQQRADEAVAALAGTHFDIPEPVRRIEGCIAPTHDGGIYYTGPSEDFSRPGRMWWSVPEGVESFGTWRELTTVYHEGVPGHHLQIGQTAARTQLLNKWRRLACWVSGHGEGWALYAEWLMAELGFMDDPGNRMGLLDSQALRATRVVIDIGVHCGFPAPDAVGGGEWTYEKAWDYFNRHVSMEPGAARFEVNRYFGWPGQAPAYKLGERQWLALRSEVAQALGDDFDLKAFHRSALDIGSVGLDVLREAVLDALLPPATAPSGAPTAR